MQAVIQVGVLYDGTPCLFIGKICGLSQYSGKIDPQRETSGIFEIIPLGGCTCAPSPGERRSGDEGPGVNDRVPGE